MRYSENPNMFMVRVAEDEMDKKTLVREASNRRRPFETWASTLPDRYMHRVMIDNVDDMTGSWCIEFERLMVAKRIAFIIKHDDLHVVALMYNFGYNEMMEATEYDNREFSTRGLMGAVQDELVYCREEGLMDEAELYEKWLEEFASTGELL